MVSDFQTRDAARFCGEMHAVFGDGVYWKSTGVSALGKSAAKNRRGGGADRIEATGRLRPKANLVAY
jgi:hypothetical protein